MNAYYVERPDGFHEVTASEWKAAKESGCEVYSLRHIEGAALVATDPSGSFSFEGVKNWKCK